ncbi:MAG: PAS domain-containing protein, partial [Bacteroidia bacterium]|nr:PAS domain-containing protein [Bacteroidia bacterium]
TQADPIGTKIESVRTDFQKTADEIVLSNYAPAGVIINDTMDIVHFRGHTSDYLEQTPGKPSHNLLKLAKKGLAFELRSLIHKAKKEKKIATKDTIQFPLTDKLQSISIEVLPLPNTIEPYYLVLFTDTTRHQKTGIKGKKKTSSAKEKKDAKDLRIEQLEKELAQIHEDMHSITEEQEATNEELQSDNEELLSSSEELQSLNEELETSKEELQSTNEELTVVNQEIVNLNELVTDSLAYSDAIVSTIREPLLVLDQNLRVKTANSSYYQLFQVKKLDTEGEFLYSVNNNQWDINALRRLLEKMLPEKTTFKDFEITQTFPVIGERVMLLNASELRKQGSSEKLILLAMEDITARKHLQIKEDKLRGRIEAHALMVQDMLMTAPAYICTLTGPDHVYDLVNSKYQQLFGNRPLEGLPIFKALPELAGQGFDLIFDKVYTNGENYNGTDVPIWLARDIGLAPELRYFNFNYQPMYDENKKIYSILVFGYEVTDMMREKILKEELDQKYTHQLEEKVKQRTDELLVVNKELHSNIDELGKMIRELESFTYVASHDLQEPLRKIQTFANRLLEKETDNLSETGKDYFTRMQRAAKRMQQLITDLLAFSRVSTSERKFERTNLDLIVADIKNNFKDIIEEKKATIESSGLGEVNTIKFQFYQVMQNLIGNALKFSNPARAPHITIKSENVLGAKLNQGQADLLSDQTNLPLNKLDPETIYCHISVADNGIGFDPQYKSRIFELFQRLHGKEAFNGTGIGLSIVKKIVENHKGVVTANGELDKGSTFHVYLPNN